MNCLLLTILNINFQYVEKKKGKEIMLTQHYYLLLLR